MAPLEEPCQVHISQMSEHPLAPDDIVASGLRRERVQTATDVAFHSRRVFAEERPGLFKELLIQFDHVDRLEERQQETLRNAADARAAVESSPSSRLCIRPLGRKHI